MRLILLKSIKKAKKKSCGDKESRTSITSSASSLVFFTNRDFPCFVSIIPRIQDSI